MDGLNYSIVIAGIGIVLALVAFLKKMKKGTRMTLGILGISAIAISLVAFAMPSTQFGAFLGTPLAAGDVQPQLQQQNQQAQVQQPSTLAICAVEDTTVTLSGQNKYTSVATGGNHRYRVNGAPAKTVADAGTFTASPGDVLSVLWLNESATGSFASTGTYTVPCSGTKTFSTLTVGNGSLTTKILDQDANDLISASNGENLAAGDVVDLSMTLQSDYQKDIPYGLVRVVEYNKSTLDEVKLLSDGFVLVSASVPISDTPILAGSSTRIAYLIPELLSNAEYKYTVHIDADDTLNPSALDSNITFRDYPRTFFVDDDNGGSYSGPAAEDEDNVVTRTGQYTSTLNID